jgi:hypothetical protein
MDLGYVTHAVHANSRMVYLRVLSHEKGVLKVRGPPNSGIYPPGPGWFYVVISDIASEGVRVMIGSGEDPPVDEKARHKCVLLICASNVADTNCLSSLLVNSDVDQYEHAKGKSSALDGSE